MAGRRAVTEGILYEGAEDDSAFDLNGLKDDEMNAYALAYAMGQDCEDEDEDDQPDEEEEDEEGAEKQVDSDVDDLDFQNFKGIYFNEDPNRKY